MKCLSFIIRNAEQAYLISLTIYSDTRVCISVSRRQRYANFDWSNFVFNLVFCATTATIVSGAMAERTKFLSYCIYSAVISAVVYPIETHWIWGGGWLAALGFHDFAGSCAIHMVGGLSAFIGAAIEGARIGKFTRDENGKVTKVHAFPGHNRYDKYNR